MAERESTNPSQHPQTPESLAIPTQNIFGDEFALEPLGVPDVHQVSPIDVDDSHDATLDTPRRSLSWQRTIDSEGGSIRRNRLSQRSAARYSTPSRQDGRFSDSSNPSRSVTSVSESGDINLNQHHSVRTISTFGFPRAQSPYQGATGPSQPYGMYPQVAGVSRSTSVATTSTIRRPERSYTGPSGPTQPYGMYAQGVVPEDDIDAVAGMSPPIVAGFAGSGSTFQRRLGPDGEDVDDLIGPDGYTEQLPPYSRYANGIPPKYTSGIGSLNGSTRRSAPPPPEPLQEGSEETLNSPEGREAGLVNPFNDSSTQINSDTSESNAPKDEGGNFKEKVQRRARRKVCFGVPCWLCLALVLVVFLAVLLGGLVGGLIAHHRGEEKGRKEALATFTPQAAAPTATITQIAPPPDVVSLTATPSNLPALPTGLFSVTLNDPIVATNSCLTTSDQACAWDCATSASLNINVSYQAPNMPVASLSYSSTPSAPIRYGAQPPEIGASIPLMLRKDKYANDRGPAYVFAQPYNKTVIVRAGDLPNGYPGSYRSFIKRWFSNDEDSASSTDIHERDSQSQWTDNSYAVPTDKPWYCFWNGTILEGFIYLYEDAKSEPSESAAIATAAATNAMPSIGPYAIRAKRQAAPTPSPSPYPKMIKIEERRNPQNPIQPYCQQMQILNSNQPGLLMYPNTQDLIQVQLTENEPLVQHQAVSPYQSQQQDPDDGQGQEDGGYYQPSSSTPPSTSGSSPWRRGLDRRDTYSYAPMCQCVWLS